MKKFESTAAFLMAMSFSLLLGVVMPLRAEAALNLPPPQELLKKASTDRRALREALLDMQLNLSEMRDPETFDNYFFLLAAMEPLAEKLKLGAIFPLAVEQTGLKMVAHGIRWMDLSQRPSSDALYYLRFADGDVVRRLVEETDIFTRSNVSEDARRKVAANLEIMIPFVEKKFADRRDVRISVRELLSSIAIRFLRSPKLTDEDAKFWIAKISLPTAYAEYLETLNQTILDTAVKDSAGLASLAIRLAELGGKISSETYPLPAYISVGWGDATIDLILRSIQGERAFAKGQFEQLVGYMRSRQLQALSSQWLSAERLPTSKYADAYLSMSNVVIAKLRAAGLSREAAEVSAHIAKLAAPIHGSKVNLEGMYTLQAKDGTEFKFSVVRARNNLLFAALGMGSGMVTKAYFNVTYSVETGRFIASQREPDLDSNPNAMISFTVSPNGAIEIEDPIAQQKWAKLSGKKTATYTNLLDDETAQPNLTEGNWEGEMVVAKRAMKVRLTITRFAGYSLGRLTTTDGLQIDFQFGSSGGNGVVYLTTGQLHGTSWIQIRAKRIGDSLDGLMISGVLGVTSPYFRLKKVQ